MRPTSERQATGECVSLGGGGRYPFGCRSLAGSYGSDGGIFDQLDRCAMIVGDDPPHSAQGEGVRTIKRRLPLKNSANTQPQTSRDATQKAGKPVWKSLLRPFGCRPADSPALDAIAFQGERQ